MEELKIEKPRSAWRDCQVCGYPHFHPWTIYRQWVQQFGHFHIFREGKKAGHPTRRTEQTLRWQAIVDKHREAEKGRP